VINDELGRIRKETVYVLKALLHRHLFARTEKNHENILREDAPFNRLKQHCVT
jgi:hypothetical protein